MNASQLKVLAVILMTIDHIGAFASDVPFVAQHMILFRSVGRLAMPIFLFLNVQSIRYTHSKKRFLLRLYLTGMGTGLFVTVSNLLLGEQSGYFSPGNILFSFFYVALYSLILERKISSFRENNTKSLVCSLCVLFLSIFPTIFHATMLNLLQSRCRTQRMLTLCTNLLDSLVPSFANIDYGIGIIVLGVTLYFARTKKRQCIVYAAFSTFCILVTFSPVLGIPYLCDLAGSPLFSAFFNRLQCFMILALPLLMMYDRNKGKANKWFFYVYYPVHREVIFLVSRLFV